MTTPAAAPLEGQHPTPTRPHAAEQAAPRTTVGEPTGVARQGVRTACLSDRQPGDGRYPVAWLHISAPKGAVPTATSRCLCGWDRSAIGHKRVTALIQAHADHRTACPLRNPQEERAAA
ncbi:hypothetical protein [Streptomyces sp. NPDC003273]|uniref:hypothetical protein n=1 Tax=Streptomyces sp. NPDC003273 TaxID=3364678 RepID=UPI0036ACCBD2